MSDVWKRCSVCKREIPFQGRYYVCSVSTCNAKRTGLVFCSVDCWDAHLPGARHREGAGAVEERAPSRADAAGTILGGEQMPGPARAANKVSASPGDPVPTGVAHAPGDTDILVVASKVKKYIRDVSGMNTSASTLETLSRCIILLCDQAVKNARADERKTVMDRDIPGIRFS